MQHFYIMKLCFFAINNFQGYRLLVLIQKTLRNFDTHWKSVKVVDDFAIENHLLLSNHALDFEDFSILTINDNGNQVTLIERLLTNVDHPPLNKDEQSLPLELYFFIT